MTREVLGFYDLTFLTVLEFDFDIPVIHVSVVGLQANVYFHQTVDYFLDESVQNMTANVTPYVLDL